MASRNPARKTKNWLILPSFQIRFSILLSLAALSGIVAFGFATGFLIHENYELLVELSPMDEMTKSLMASEFQTIVVRMIALSIGFTLFFFVMGILLSHRIAGPLYRFQKHFRDAAKSKGLHEVRLRPKDEFQDLAAAHNEMVRSLKEK
jgi:methyl-accepting chemotaxis protein